MKNRKVERSERGKFYMNKAIMFILLGAFLIGLPLAAAYTTTVSNAVRPTSYSTVRTDAVSVAAKDVKEVKQTDASKPESIVIASPRNVVHQDSVVNSAKPREAVERVPGKVENKRPITSNRKPEVSSQKSFRADNSDRLFESDDVVEIAQLNDTNNTEQNSSNGTGVWYCKGDINKDGLINGQDIDPFVVLLGQSVTTHAEIAQIPWSIWLGDFDNDWDVDFEDIDPFVETLVGTRKPFCRSIPV